MIYHAAPKDLRFIWKGFTLCMEGHARWWLADFHTAEMVYGYQVKTAGEHVRLYGKLEAYPMKQVFKEDGTHLGYSSDTDNPTHDTEFSVAWRLFAAVR